MIIPTIGSNKRILAIVERAAAAARLRVSVQCDERHDHNAECLVGPDADVALLAMGDMLDQMHNFVVEIRETLKAMPDTGFV